MDDHQIMVLINGCLNGDRKNQRALFDCYKRATFALCLRYARDKFQAQDMLQEGFIKVFKDLASYNASKGALWTWMRRVIINACLQYIRKNRKFEQECFIGEETDVVQYEDVSSSSYSPRDLLSYLQQLPNGYRTVFNLHVMEGYTHPEIAEILNISINTSKSQLSKAKAFLRKCLKEGNPENVTSKLAVTR
ncbi:MAG: sigma-70 family RNA polymerase sigma factor [Saprospiraceae bacterium]|nr:sigma-70 family RNA polymerase sigma factor [Saprospiraceae bacterium]